MRERVAGWDVFLEPFSGVRQCSRLGSVAVRACHNKQAGSNVDMSTADNRFRLKEDGQQKNDKLSVQLKNTRLSQVIGFRYLHRDRHEIFTEEAIFFSKKPIFFF